MTQEELDYQFQEQLNKAIRVKDALSETLGGYNNGSTVTMSDCENLAGELDDYADTLKEIGDNIYQYYDEGIDEEEDDDTDEEIIDPLRPSDADINEVQRTND